MGPEIMEMRRLQKTLPPRPSFSQLEWALSTIGRVNSNLAVRRDELGRQPRPAGVPASVFEALQEMRKEALEEEAYQQRQQAEAISRLEQRHRLYDAWIQLAYDALSSSLSLTATTSSSPPALTIGAPTSKVFPAPPPIAASASAAGGGGGGGSAKSASDTKRDLFPSEGSTTSATQLSSAAPAPAIGEDEQADTPISLHKLPIDGVVDLPPRSSPGAELKNCSSDRRGCNWSEHETFLLIDGKRKLAEEMRACPSSALFKSKQQRWEFVAGFLENLRVHKTWQQCVYRWNRLWKPFKTIHGYESAILSKHVSYWRLSPSERVDKRLPRNYSVKVFEVLKQNFVVDRTLLSSTTLEAPGLPLSVCKDEGMDKSPISIEKGDSDVDASPKLEDVGSSPRKGKTSGKKRRNSVWLDAVQKDPMLHRFTVTPGVRLSSCMLAAWDF